MQAASNAPAPAPAQSPAPAALAELQDELMIATTDLDRLQALLTDAVEQLMARFMKVDGLLTQAAQAGCAPGDAPRAGAPQTAAPADQVANARCELGGAIVAMQFQDLAAQLLTHALQRVRSVADCLGNHAMPVEADAAAETVAVQFVARACPVAQRQMDAGSIELY